MLIEGKKGLLALATLIPGSIFGELSFFDQRPRSARVPVTADCTVLKISESSFQTLVSQGIGAAMAFVQDLCDQNPEPSGSLHESDGPDAGQIGPLRGKYVNW